MTEIGDALARIRDAELEAAALITAAEERAESDVAAAHVAAQRIVEEAKAAGAAEADAAFAQVIAEAEKQARSIATTHRSDADNLRAAVEPRLPGLAEEMLRVILPPAVEAPEAAP